MCASLMESKVASCSSVKALTTFRLDYMQIKNLCLGSECCWHWQSGHNMRVWNQGERWQLLHVMKTNSDSRNTDTNAPNLAGVLLGSRNYRWIRRDKLCKWGVNLHRFQKQKSNVKIILNHLISMLISMAFKSWGFSKSCLNHAIN